MINKSYFIGALCAAFSSYIFIELELRVKAYYRFKTLWVWMFVKPFSKAWCHCAVRSCIVSWKKHFRKHNVEYICDSFYAQVES